MAPRRIQRSAKLCAFHAKKATGRTVLRLTKLPSTRQKTGVAGPPLCLDSCNTGLLETIGQLRANPYCNQYCTAGASLSCAGGRDATKGLLLGLKRVAPDAYGCPNLCGFTKGGKGRSDKKAAGMTRRPELSATALSLRALPRRLPRSSWAWTAAHPAE